MRVMGGTTPTISSVPTALKKKPRHILIKADFLLCKDIKRSIGEVVAVATEYGIEYLTILDEENVLKPVLESVCGNSILAGTVYLNHLPCIEGKESRLSINVITANQKHHFVDRLKELSQADPKFRFNADNLLSSLSPFPQVDLIITTASVLSLDGCLPPQIGFAEIWYYQFIE